MDQPSIDGKPYFVSKEARGFEGCLVWIGRGRIVRRLPVLPTNSQLTGCWVGFLVSPGQDVQSVCLGAIS